MKLLSLIILSAAIAPLGAQDPTIVADIDESFRLAGVRSMLESLPSHVNEMTSAAVAQFPRDQRRQFEPEIRDVSLRFLDADSFYRQLRSYFAKHYDAAHMNTFLALERTSAYRTMRRQEELAQTAAAQAARRRFEMNLKSDPPSPARVALLQQLDKTRGSSDLEVKMVTGILNAMSDGLGAQMPADLEAQSAAFKEKIRPILSGNVLIQNLYAYRNASDTDLADYVAAAEQKDVAWFNRTLQSAVVAVAAERAARAGEYLKTKVSQRTN